MCVLSVTVDRTFNVLTDEKYQSVHWVSTYIHLETLILDKLKFLCSDSYT